MDDEAKKHPEGSGTRGGGSEWPHPYPRCIDCPQFDSLGGRVDRLEVKASSIDARLHTVERNQDRHTTKLDLVGKDLKMLVTWLTGNGSDTGFKSEWAVARSRMAAADKWKWLAIGVLVTGTAGATLTFIGMLIRDLATRGQLS